MLPPGPFPTRRAIKNAKYRWMIGLHHSTSLLAGLPTSMYFADKPEFQFMGILLAGYPMLMIGFDLFVKTVDNRYQTLHALAELLVSFGFAYQRWFMYFPMVAPLLQTVYASDIPLIAKVSLALGGLMMSLFNLMLFGLIVKSVQRLARQLRGEKANPPCVAAEDVQRENDPKTVEVQEKQQSDFPTLLEPSRKRQQHKKA